MKTNTNRLWSTLMEMAQIGATEQGGNTRLALTDLDREGRQRLIDWASAIGMHVDFDVIGNMFLRREGLDASLPPIVMGSHLDTQPKGGRFDGIYGVLAGLEVLQCLYEQQIKTRHPIEIAVWMNEEGARFTPAMMGSGVFVGLLDQEQVRQTCDKDGISVAAELVRTGQSGELPLKRNFAAYYELHIEQGPVLEKNQNAIGVVTGGQAIIWLDIEVSGQAAHAGTTPMAMRRDAMIASAQMITALEEMILKEFPQGLITFGELSVAHSSRNTIPQAVQWTIDLRHPNDAEILKMEQRVTDYMHKIAQQRDVALGIQRHWFSPATMFDPDCIETVQIAVNELGYRHQQIVSGAGHDAIHLAKHCPTTMIFIPCENGLSHNEAENITPLQAQQGAEVLLRSVLKFDQRQQLACVS